MRIASIYDIHGNPSALEAVLRDIYESDVDLIVVGGDVVAGPMPVETLDILQNIRIPIHFILGNAESDVLKHLAGKDINGLSGRANQEARWVSEQLSPKHKQFISSWKTTFQIKIDPWGEILFCHGTPDNNMEVFTRKTPEEKLVSIFGNLTASVVICGHTHMQFERSIGGIRIVNAGSVGMPFGRTGADWLLLDTAINFKHTDFDINKASNRIRQSAYPYAEDFVTNHVLRTPSEKDMLKMLTQMEVNQAKNKKT